MSDKNFKDMRKQIRNVAQENIPAILRSETFTGFKDEVLREVQQSVKFQLEAIQADITSTLARMEKRSQDVQTYILNNVQASMAQNVPTEAALVDPTPPTTES